MFIRKDNDHVENLYKKGPFHRELWILLFELCVSGNVSPVVISLIVFKDGTLFTLACVTWSRGVLIAIAKHFAFFLA